MPIQRCIGCKNRLTVAITKYEKAGNRTLTEIVDFSSEKI